MHSSSAYNTVALETFLLSNLIWVLFKTDFNTRQNKTTVYFCLGKKKRVKALLLMQWVHQTLVVKGSLKNQGLFKTYFHKVANLGENNFLFLWFREQMYPFMFIYFSPSSLNSGTETVFNKLTWQKLRCIWCLHKTIVYAVFYVKY